MNIKTYVEKERGCGFKKPGGLYLIGASAGFAPCCKLPFALRTCPCCGSSIQFTRGYTWITSDMFCFQPAANGCSGSCVMMQPDIRMGLMWVGANDYPFPKDFMREAAAIGISKRLNVLPPDLQEGTWIALAHAKAVPVINPDPAAAPGSDLVTYLPGVFMVFKMEKIQYVVKPDDSSDKLKDLFKKNVELIRVEREGAPLTINFD